MAVYQEFTMNGNAAWHALQAFIKAMAPKALQEKRPLRVIVVDEEADRLDEQIRTYFWIVGHVANQVWVGQSPRRQYSKQQWHEYFCLTHLEPTEIELPNGQTTLKRASIARGKIGIRAMSAFKNKVEAEAVSEMGVRLPAREDEQ